MSFQIWRFLVSMSDFWGVCNMSFPDVWGRSLEAQKLHKNDAILRAPPRQHSNPWPALENDPPFTADNPEIGGIDGTPSRERIYIYICVCVCNYIYIYLIIYISHLGKRKNHLPKCVWDVIC